MMRTTYRDVHNHSRPRTIRPLWRGWYTGRYEVWYWLQTRPGYRLWRWAARGRASGSLDWLTGWLAVKAYRALNDRIAYDAFWGRQP